jgi:hypothetical protein
MTIPYLLLTADGYLFNIKSLDHHFIKATFHCQIKYKTIAVEDDHLLPSGSDLHTLPGR